MKSNKLGSLIILSFLVATFLIFTVQAQIPTITVTKTVNPTDVYVADSGEDPEWFEITIEVTGFGVETAPTDVNVVETTRDYIIDESSFSITPDFIDDNFDGTTTIEWEDIEDITGVGDGVGPFTASETFTVTFMARCNTFGNNLPVDMDSVPPLSYPEPAVVYKDPTGQDASVPIPQAYINVASAATVETYLEGAVADTFSTDDPVDVYGDNYEPYTEYPFYVVPDTTWVDGMQIPDRVPGAETVVTSSPYGTLWAIGPIRAWTPPLTPGAYDIVVDVNGNGNYDEGIDALDDFDVETAGFFVIPEVAIGSIMALAAMLVALILFAYKKKQTTKQ